MTTTSEMQAKKLETIRGLLATAESLSDSNPQAAESYTERAMALMAQYGIDQAMIDATAAKPEAPGDIRIEVHGPYISRKVELLGWTAAALRCKPVVSKRGGKTTLHIFGMTSDLERLELLYTSLLIQAVRGAVATPVPWHENTRAFRESWLRGFAMGVSEKLKAAETRATQDAAEAQAEAYSRGITSGPSTDVVLASREAQVERAQAAAYPKLRKARATNLSGGGYQQGRAAGQRADLGGARVGSGSRRALA